MLHFLNTTQPLWQEFSISIRGLQNKIEDGKIRSHLKFCFNQNRMTEK